MRARAQELGVVYAPDEKAAEVAAIAEFQDRGRAAAAPHRARAGMMALRCAATIGMAMTDEQFRAIRGLLVTIVILLGLIAGILLALAWEYL